MIESVLAQQIASIIAPYLPYLMSPTISMGKDAAIKALGGKFVEAVWNKAADIWSRLKPNVEKDPDAVKALTDISVAVKNQDTRAETLLSFQLEKLTLPAGVLNELQNLVTKTDSSAQINVATNRGVAIQGPAFGNVINTGDQK